MRGTFGELHSEYHECSPGFRRTAIPEMGPGQLSVYHDMGFVSLGGNNKSPLRFLQSDIERSIFGQHECVFHSIAHSTGECRSDLDRHVERDAQGRIRLMEVCFPIKHRGCGKRELCELDGGN